MSEWLRHPLHPALAHFPVALWLGAAGSDLMGLRTGAPTWWTLSYYAIAAGTVMGGLTLLAGLLELWLRRVPREALTWLVVHASLMFCALLCFMASLGWRTATPPPTAALAMSFAGAVIVLVGGFCGGTLVYRFGVGVSWREAGRPNP